jgi:hypothetical protein
MEMKNLDAVPRFIEPGDAQDRVLALPIFVTRPADDATRRQRLAALAAAMEETESNAAERPLNR